MADPDRPPLRRRFVTRADIEAAHRSGEAVTLGPDDVITHEAAQRATDLGVAVSRPERRPPPEVTGPGLRPLVAEPVPTRRPDRSGAEPATRSAAGSGGGSGGTSAGENRLREAVRAAVVAELGTEPPGLDAVIDDVLERRRR
jgi:hypothetical protein